MSVASVPLAPDRTSMYVPEDLKPEQLYEGTPDTHRATEYYGRFVDLWAHADPELQPRVAEARTRMEQLNRSKR